MWSRHAIVAISGLALGVVAPAAPAAECRHQPPVFGPEASPNDNRTAAGTIQDGIVTIRLVMRDVSWHPDGPNGCALSVRAFAEEGDSARIPGPMIRVASGTEVRVQMRNDLRDVVWVRGLQARDAMSIDSTAIEPNATHEFRFRAGRPGAWYYWAGAFDARVPASNENGQLVGALVVDPVPSPATGEHFVGDRVFVMTRWTPGGTTGNLGFQLNAINGQSWPHTERLTYTVGDSVRWHVINASDELHMMHLHGFYYRVEARGDAAHDSALTRSQPPTVVTTATRRGEWMSIVWSPDRSGNWLFHCHFVSHMSASQRLDRMTVSGSPVADESHDHDTTASEGSANHATESMAGLLFGVTVRPARNAARAPVSKQPIRIIHVFADTRPNMFGDRPGFGFVVQKGSRPPVTDSLPIPGTPLLLTRGEPVHITVHNRIATPLTVHWHGIELESYADGVGGWSGAGQRIAPMIAPGDSFVAHFTPPRAGTFMYHVHNEHGDELASGLYAPLLVLEPGQTFDPRTDRVFVIATGGPDAERGNAARTLINGSASPDTLDLLVGTTYRLRLIDISANDAHATTLAGPSGLVMWRELARDGRALPAERPTPQPAREITASGVTRDFEFTPANAGDFALTVATIVAGRPSDKVVKIPIRVHEQ